MKQVNVAVGVIKRDNQIFISKRADNLHQGGLWEFPGGKQEENESIEQALSRELFEEVDITVTKQSAMMLIEHDYGDKQVCLHIQLVEDFSGDAKGKEGQIARWVDIADLHQYAFPEANQKIIENLLSGHSAFS